ncbi:TonB-dependent receptor domain-containing protein [Sphingomonas sp.]|uniref:TonB-dependent receptor domain-containing protein n=1 Tax=Sphingomonas sp. TaxID=28214 RepID=UPI0035AFBC68
MGTAIALVAPAMAQTVTPAPVPQNDATDEKTSPDLARTKAEHRADRPVDQPAGTDGPDLIVTGTRIVRPNMASNAPITVVDSDFIRQRGIARLEESLFQLPQVAPGLGAQGTGWTAGRAEINLRGLGPGRTLTLLNGQRIVNDANLIPGALVERVDLLTGGASAVYGSDAIAGVVNFIIKRRFEGLTFDGEISGFNHRNNNQVLLRAADAVGYRRPQSNFLGGGNFFASLAGGKTIIDDRVNISGFVRYRETVPVRLTDLDTTICPLMMNAPNATVFRNDTFACQQPPFYPRNLFGFRGQNYTANPDGSRGWRVAGPADAIVVPRDAYLQRREKAWTGGGFISADLFSDIRLDGNFIYNRSRQESVIVEGNQSYADGVVNCDNPLMSPAQASLICGTRAGTTQLSNAFPTSLYRPNFTQTMRPIVTDWRGAVTLAGTIVDKIRFEASYQRSRNVYDNNIDRAFHLNAWERIGRGLQVRNVNGTPTCVSRINGTDPDCVPIDIFAGNPMNNQAVFNYLTAPGVARQQNDLEVLNLIVSGTLGDYGIKSPFASNGIGFALVAEQRRDRFQSTGSGSWANFNIFDGRTRVREYAAELDVPLVENVRFIDELGVNGGYRLSDYDTYNRLVHTWKVEGTYQPFAGLRFRGSYNRALRVPVQQRLEGENRYPNFFALDLCAPPGPSTDPNVTPAARWTFEQCSRGGLTRQQYDALTSYTGCRPDGTCPATLINGGNPNLQPERSESYTAGVVLQPKFLPGFSASVDWYDINISGAFEWARWWLAFDQCYRDSTEVFCNMYRRDATTGRLQEVDARWANSGFVRTRGFDFTTNYRLDPRRFGIEGEVGTFDLNFNATLTTRNQRQFAANNPTWSCLGYHSFECGSPTPRWRHIAGLTWALRPSGATMNLAWRYIGGTQVARFSSDSVLRREPTATDPQTYPLIGHLPAVSYFDFAMNVPLTRAVTVRFNVQNLFDRDPPLIGQDRTFSTGSSYNTHTTFYDVRGRTLRIGLTATL